MGSYHWEKPSGVHSIATCGASSYLWRSCEPQPATVGRDAHMMASRRPALSLFTLNIEQRARIRPHQHPRCVPLHSRTRCEHTHPHRTGVILEQHGLETRCDEMRRDQRTRCEHTHPHRTGVILEQRTGGLETRCDEDVLVEQFPRQQTGGGLCSRLNQLGA